MRFSINDVKPVNIPFGFHCKIYSTVYPIYKEEKVMSHVLYDSKVGGLMNAMKWYDILHAACVVNEHMTSRG